MAIWIQSLSWALIYSLGQGFMVYALLWLVFKLVPVTSANVRYHLSLSALTVLLAWFAGTWWQQFHSLALVQEQLSSAHADGTTIIWVPVQLRSMEGSLGSWHSLQSSLSVFFPWLCACYTVGFGFMVVRLMAGVSHLFSLRSGGAIQPDKELNELLFTQKKRIGLDTPVQLLISLKAQVPMVIGFFKPVVLIPAAALAQLDTKQLETILLHELAHIKRHDYLVNILQTVIETILFFNPFVWIIGKITRREREYCCDDLVVGNTPEPLFYATALSVLASRKSYVPPMAVAASGRSTHLYDRIQRIMEMKNSRFSYSRMAATVVLIATIACSIAWIRPTFSRTKKGKATATSSRKATAENKLVANSKEETPGTEKDNSAKTNVTRQVATKAVSEEDLLVQRLLNDKLVDQVRGFVVERKKDQLFINGQLQSADVAVKYLAALKKEWIRVQVFSMEDRLRMHPNADFLQLLLPVSLESPCVQKDPKDGC